MAKKSINAEFLYPDSLIDVFKSGKAYGIAWGPPRKSKSRAAWTGVLISDEETAMAMSNYFKQMANALKKLKLEKTKEKSIDG